jgi:hypothetical protein
MFNGKAVNTTRKERQINMWVIKGKRDVQRQKRERKERKKKGRNKIGSDVPSLFTNSSAAL